MKSRELVNLGIPKGETMRFAREAIAGYCKAAKQQFTWSEAKKCITLASMLKSHGYLLDKWGLQLIFVGKRSGRIFSLAAIVFVAREVGIFRRV